MDEGVFFGSSAEGERPFLSPSQLSLARRICSTCPVRIACLTQALGAIPGSPREEYGIWAGTSRRTRKRIWEQVAAGDVTLEQVVTDFENGVGEKYEHERTLETPQLMRVG